MKKEIILKGKGFILSPYKKEDFVSLVKNANSKEIAKNFLNDFKIPFKEKNAENFITEASKYYLENPKIVFVIDIDGLAVGYIGGNFNLRKNFIFRFGYWLGKKYWGKGITSEATKIYTKYIFKTFKKIQRIETTVFLWNEGSKRVLEKNGFKLEGILRKNHYQNGKILDEYVFSKLRNEK
jgi:ribosomal-protein-alanine N-acetyltransferase